jgi:hypothetical protein
LGDRIYEQFHEILMQPELRKRMNENLESKATRAHESPQRSNLVVH